MRVTFHIGLTDWLVGVSWVHDRAWHNWAVSVHVACIQIVISSHSCFRCGRRNIADIMNYCLPCQRQLRAQAEHHYQAPSHAEASIDLAYTVVRHGNGFLIRWFGREGIWDGQVHDFVKIMDNGEDGAFATEGEAAQAFTLYTSTFPGGGLTCQKMEWDEFGQHVKRWFHATPSDEDVEVDA